MIAEAQQTQLTARERMLRVMAHARPRPFTIRQLAATAGATYASAGRLVWEMRRAGSVRCAAPKANGLRDGDALYVVERMPALRRGNAQQRMWQALRVLRQFSIVQLAAAAGAEQNHALKFVKALEGAGFVHCVMARRSGVKLGGAVYALAHDVGPLAPRIRAGFLLRELTNGCSKS